MARIIAVLETMWDSRNVTTSAGYKAEAPRYFRINPQNHSGRRLYRLIGAGHELLVTNACRELVRSANEHGTPDPAWLAENLSILAETHPFELVLVCGKVAQRTYELSNFKLPAGAAYLYTPHPAARTWSKALISNTSRLIADTLRVPA